MLECWSFQHFVLLRAFTELARCLLRSASRGWKIFTINRAPPCHAGSHVALKLRWIVLHHLGRLLVQGVVGIGRLQHRGRSSVRWAACLSHDMALPLLRSATRMIVAGTIKQAQGLRPPPIPPP